MLIALLMSLALIALGEFGLIEIDHKVEALLRGIDFYEVLMHGMLSLLLFAGAMHIDLSELAAQKWPIGILATVGTLSSTFLVGAATWVLFDLIDLFLFLTS